MFNFLGKGWNSFEVFNAGVLFLICGCVTFLSYIVGD